MSEYPESPRPVAVVTGASSGVGRSTAIDLAGAGHDLVLVGRDADRLEQTAVTARGLSPQVNVGTRTVDLADLGEVRALADRLAEDPPRVVVSNAALIPPVDARNSQGLPLSLVVNHLAPYLLMRTLVEPIGSRPARFVVVGGLPSALSRTAADLDDLELRDPHRLGPLRSFRPVIAYGRTKSMNLMFVNGLDARLPGTSGVTIAGAHPGVVRGTRLDRHDRGAARIFGQAWSRLARDTVQEAAARMAWLATAPDLEGKSGFYVVGRSFADTPWHTRDPERVDRLWNLSADLVGLEP